MPRALSSSGPRYWVNTVSLDHVRGAVAGGFTQARHGLPATLKRLRRGDWMVFYSPKTALSKGESVQAWTALGQIADDAIYIEPVQPNWMPARRRMEFTPREGTKRVPIHPMLGSLSFIRNERRWGYVFIRGMFEIPKRDFDYIKEEMDKAEVDGDGCWSSPVKLALLGKKSALVS